MMRNERSCAGSTHSGGLGCVKTQYESAMLRTMARDDDIAAPIVPDDKTNAEDVLRPRLGPEMTRSI